MMVEERLGLALPEFPGGSLDRTTRKWSEIQFCAGVDGTPEITC